jgi:hypothetical protein
MGIIFYIVAVKVVNSVQYHNSDFFTYWLSGRLASLGHDPYNSQVWVAGHHQYGAKWIPNSTLIYPLPISWLFIPFGWLPLYQAYVLWDILTQFLIVSSVALLLRINSSFSAKHYVFPILTGVILFRSTIITLLNGQLSGMLLFIIALIIDLWEKEKWWQGAVLMPILALKPNLGGPLIVLLAVYLLLHKRVIPILAAAASGSVILLASWVQNPNWIIEFWNAGAGKLSQTFGYSPTIWGVSAYLCKFDTRCTLGYGAFSGILLLTGYIYLLVWKRKALSPALVVSIVVALTLLITPYTWSYDQLLLVAPIIVITVMLAKAGYSYLAVACFFLSIDVLALILLVISLQIQMEIWNASIPLLLLGVLVWYLSSTRLKRNPVGSG